MAVYWTMRLKAGQSQWISDANMALVLLLNTILFVLCYKLSFAGIGLDTWRVQPEQLTEILHVRPSFPTYKVSI